LIVDIMKRRRLSGFIAVPVGGFLVRAIWHEAHSSLLSFCVGYNAFSHRVEWRLARLVRHQAPNLQDSHISFCSAEGMQFQDNVGNSHAEDLLRPVQDGLGDYEAHVQDQSRASGDIAEQAWKEAEQADLAEISVQEACKKVEELAAKCALMEAELEEERAHSQRAADAWCRELQAERERSQKLEERAVNAERLLQEMTDEVTLMKKSLDKANNKVMKLTKKIIRLANDFTSEQQIKLDLVTKISALQNSYYDVMEKLDGSRCENHVTKAESERLRRQLQQKSERVNELEDEINQQTAELKVAQQKLGSVRASLNAAVQAFVSKTKLEAKTRLQR